MVQDPATLAAAADRAIDTGDRRQAACLRLATLRGLLELWEVVEPLLAGLADDRAHDLQRRQDELRELLIRPDRWPVAREVTALADALRAVESGGRERS